MGNHNKTQTHIKKYSFSVALIGGTDYLPSFAYTTGLWESFKHPEIICFGLSTQNLHILLNEVGELVKTGETITTG